MMLRRLLVTALLAALHAPLVAAEAPKPGSPWEEQMELRMLRMERQFQAQQMIDMHTRLGRVQKDVELQNGTLETLNHRLDMIEKRQREIYQDIDRRLSQLERGQTVSAAAASGEASSVSDEQGVYQKAFDLLRELRYEQAIAGFTQFLADYPNAEYAPLAQYWIGEAHYAGQQYEQAIAAYNRLIANYPKSPKRAEGLLKIGYSQHELGHSDEAIKRFEQIIADYPESTEANQAQAALDSLRKGKGE